MPRYHLLPITPEPPLREHGYNTTNNKTYKGLKKALNFFLKFIFFRERFHGVFKLVNSYRIIF